MSNNTELDEILEILAADLNIYADPSDDSPTPFDEAKQSLLDWHNKQIKDIRICGKSVDEIVPILSGLEIERATEITVTMANLRKLYDKLKEEQQEMMAQAIKSTLDRARTELKESR